MKNLSIALNIILLIAVIVLYVLHFSDEKGTSTSSDSSKGSAVSNLTIGYVNSDSLIKNFALYDTMKKAYDQKRGRMENDFASKAKSLEGEFSAFQKSAPSMSPGEIKAREENLMMKRQGLMQYQEQLSQQLMQEEMQMNDSVFNKISDFMKRYGKENNYDLVFGYSKGAGILYAQDSLEITEEVLKGLNNKEEKK